MTLIDLRNSINSKIFPKNENQKKVINIAEKFSTLINNKEGKEGKILTAKQMLQRLPIALGQVKADNTYENLLNEIGQIIYFLYPVKEIPKKVCNNIISSIKL